MVFWYREVETSRESLVSSLANSMQNSLPAWGPAVEGQPSMQLLLRFSPRVLSRTKHFGFSSFLQGSGFWTFFFFFFKDVNFFLKYIKR